MKNYMIKYRKPNGDRGGAMLTAPDRHEAEFQFSWKKEFKDCELLGIELFW